MTHRLVKALVVVLGAVAASSPAPARGQPADGSAPGASRNAAAEELFTQGRALLDAGRYPEACVKLAESQRLDPSAGTLLNLGEAYEKNGQTASAWATFREAARASVDRRRPDWERTAQRRAGALESRLSRVTINVPARARIAGLVVEIGALPVVPALYDTAIPLDPGAQIVTAHAPGRKKWSAQLSLRADGDRQALTVPELAVEDAAASGSAEARGPSASRAGDEARRRSADVPTVAWILGGSGVALAASGVALWVVGRNERTDLTSTCGVTSSCAHADILASRTKLVVGDVVVGAGLLAMGASVVIALSARTSGTRIALSPRGFEAMGTF